MTQEELGKILGVKKSAVQKYEAGKSVDLRAGTIKRLCATFNVFPYFFIYEEGEGFWGRNYSKAIESGDSSSPIQQLKRMEENLGERTYIGPTRAGGLNNAGLYRAIEYIDELLLIEKYRR